MLMVIASLLQFHGAVRSDSEVSHHSVQCLAQLASVNGRVFADDQSMTLYLNEYLQRFLHLMTG